MRFTLTQGAADMLVARLNEAGHGAILWLEDEGQG